MNTAMHPNQTRQEILQPAEITKTSVPTGLRSCLKALFSKLPWRSSMLNVTVQNLGDASVLHCQGRLLFGNKNLYATALSQKTAGMLVLDLAQVDGIDAGGLGVLMELRAWAQSGGIQFRLLNVMRSVQRVLERTRLNLVFEACSVPEIFHLMGRASGLETPLRGLRAESNVDQQFNGSNELQHKIS